MPKIQLESEEINALSADSEKPSQRKKSPFNISKFIKSITSRFKSDDILLLLILFILIEEGIEDDLLILMIIFLLLTGED